MTTRLWDILTGACVFITQNGHNSKLLHCAFSPDGSILATASADKTVKLWRITAVRVPTVQRPSRIMGTVYSKPDSAVPDAFLCPITQDVMTDPVQIVGGATFDRRAIADWFRRGNDTNPLTNEHLTDRTLTPNYALRSAIDEWLLARTAAAEGHQFRLALDEVEVFESQPIGRGQSKAAFRGRWRGQPVAVLRMTKADCGTEPALCVQAGRLPNVVKCFGLTDDGMRVQLISELAAHGSLDNVLMDTTDRGASLPLPVLLEIALQAAMGMQQLGGLGIIHRDLAARNVLVFRLNLADALDTLVKITDFGLAREGAVYYGGAAAGLPLRWLPPEAIERQRFSILSDIWAFGVLLWEMFSGGRMPYQHMTEPLGPSLETFLESGQRLPRPASCPEPVYALMLRCWAQVPTKRPSFEDIARDLRRLERTLRQ